MLILRAVVTSGSVTAAAMNLGYTPSAISQQMAALEKQTGMVLLERAGRGVRTTAAGQLLSEYAALISQHLAEAETKLAQLREGRAGRLVVRYFATAGAALVPPAAARLRREHPGIELDLKLTDQDDPLPEVEQGRADLAIVVRPRNRQHDGIRLIHLLDDPYRLILPRDHALARSRVVNLADLANLPWVGSEWPVGPCRRIVLDACAAAGFSPNFVVESDDHATAQGFVTAGLGISLLPRMSLGSRQSGVVVRRIRRPEPVRPIYAAVRESSLDQPALQALVTALREAAPR